MGFLEIHQRSWPHWLRGFTFAGIAGFFAFALARWPGGAGTFVVAVVLSLSIVSFLQRRARPSFSLKTVLLLTGLFACGMVLRMIGGPWKEVHHFPGHEVNVAMSPDGKLVAASQGTSIEIRETQTGRSVQTIKMAPIDATKKASGKWFYMMEFTKDGNSLMTVDWQPFPRLLDVVSGKELRKWQTETGLSALAVSGSRFLANSIVPTSTGGAIETCNVFDVELDEPILTIKTKSRFCRCISPRGSHVLVGRDETNAELWSVDEQRLIGTIPIPFIHPGLFLVKFSRDGNLVAIPTSTGIGIWDVTECRKVAEWNPQKFDHLRSLEWSPDDSRLVASFIERIGPSGPAALAAAMAGTSTRNAIEHCYLLNQDCQEIAPISGTCATFSPSGDRIATVHGGLKILDGRTGELLTRLAVSPRESILGQKSIIFSPDGNWLLTNGSPSVLRRTRSEYWYSIYQLPAFWGMVLIISAIIVQLSESIYVGRRTRSREVP